VWTINTYTVSFDTNGGSPSISPINNVAHGSTVPIGSKPADPTKTPGAGLYSGDHTAPPGPAIFQGWFDGAAEFTFGSTAVTSNVALKAKWSPEIDVSSLAGDNLVEKSIAHVKATPATYTLFVDSDMNVANQSLNVGNVKLTLVGLGVERTLQYSGPTGSNFFYMTTGGSTNQLILGDKITLRGISGSSANIVNIQSGKLTMKAGSKITGHTTSSYYGAVYLAATNSYFDMEGGSITGNDSTNTSASKYKSTGGVYTDNGGNTTLSGGSITGNTCAFYGSADVDVNMNGKLNMSGSAQVGYLRLSSEGGISYNSSSINIDAPLTTGGVSFLRLSVADTSADTLGVVLNSWPDKVVLKGPSLDTAAVGKIGQVWFAAKDGATQSIGDDFSGVGSYSSTGYRIESAAGANLGKLIAN
jgi:hypothetical protein